MEVIKNIALDLRVRKPDRVTSNIPDSKYIKQQPNGLHRVVVKWTLDNVRRLANMGFASGDVPSPISKSYDWPGTYTPFDHQRRTAGFLTANDRCYCFDEQGCVDSETEYLTPTGWRKIVEYDGALVGQYNPETQAVEFVEPEAYVKIPCAGMIHFKTKHGVDQLLSPEHRMLIGSNHCADKRVVMSAAEVLQGHDEYHAGIKRPYVGKKGCNTVAFSSAAIPASFGMPSGEGLQMSDASIRLQVAVIADGYFGSQTNWCVVRIKKERKVQRLRMLLSVAGVDYKENTPKHKGVEGFHVFKFYAPRREKLFTSAWWECSHAQREIISEEVIEWDGHRIPRKGCSFHSTSKESADFIQMVWTSCGYIARISPDEREGRNTCYTVHRRKNKSELLSLKGAGPNACVVPATDGFKYCFTVPSTFLVFRRNGCVFASGNTGKTASVIWAADYLMSVKDIRSVLIVCPLSIMRSAWADDIFSIAMRRQVIVAHGTREKREQLLAHHADFTIINYDGVKTVLDTLKDKQYDLIIADEASALKNAQTARWKAINKLVTPDTKLWMLTGTPAAQSPVDAFGLAKMNTPHRIPKYFGAWRDKVMFKITQFRWEPKSNAKKTVHHALQPAIRHLKSECLDLPPVTYETREVPLTAQQEKYYKVIKDQMRMAVAGETITAVHAAAGMQKLLQLSSGAVYSDTGAIVKFDGSSRLKVLIEVINEASHKVLVFAPFRHAIQAVADHINKNGYKTGIIDGSVSLNKRTKLIKDFQQTDKPHVMVIQPQSAAHGVTLTAADTIIWFGPTNSVETWLQANERINRPSQENKMTIIKIIGSQIERKVYNALEAKDHDQKSLMKMYKAELNDT